MDALDLIVDEGRTASAGRFFQLGSDLLALLDEISEQPVAWRVADLRLGSAVCRVAPPEDHPDEDRWLREAVGGLGAVGVGSALPTDWTPDAARVAHRLVADALAEDEDVDWVPPRLVLVTDDPGLRAPDVPLTPLLGERLADLQPFERTMPGSVRGTLVGLNVSRGNRASLRTPTGVVRVGFETALRGQLREALFHDVELRGEVRQDGDGRVFHVRADGVDVLARPAARWADLFGIAPDFTGGLGADEYLEANRGDA